MSPATAFLFLTAAMIVAVPLIITSRRAHTPPPGTPDSANAQSGC